MPGDGLNAGGPIDPVSVARFAADLAALTGEPPTARSRIGIAVSGGADSLALLLLVNAAFPGACAVATVDHGLRPEAAGEAVRVAALCQRLGVAHTVLRAGDRRGARGNLQDWARTVRYRLLADWARAGTLGMVATAHHRDDVAETFLMRAARGGGVRGLAAMPAVRSLPASPVLLVRPLLGWRRAELAAIVEAAGIDAAADPSNVDPRFDRARVRRLLATTPDLPPDGLARAADNLRDVEAAVEWMMARELADRFDEGAGGVRLRADGLPFELKRRFVARAIEAVRQRHGVFAPWRETAIPALVVALDRGAGGTVADVLAGAGAGYWLFRPAPPRRSRESAADAAK